ncbi:dihydrolipoamide dehydrogenase [Allomuricauda ruestringensis DSM 13258]|uniref:Dihydrolipoamide dehydrogenase n=1 Tax=Allomuricauda ruestringensis (strain DSM 13258 / CIP 107369 / LMG 19739 / B1) TaxID=886377 RepID=G2PP49_ALLRU|nr:collagen-like protein [Allomuricauda ruestringensis]AEM71434.1 dihydrolipoamide dehydrogenase [Allomuricauda ruestringensis DSM 13258]
MNKFSTILGVVIVFVFAACEGPQGPPGFDGLDGLDGQDGLDGIQGQVVEVEGVNFGYDGEANLFSTLITFSDVTDFEVFESDAVLVYRHDGLIDLSDGSTADAWTQIPQNYFLQGGTIQYVFAHTFVDLELFIDGNFDLSGISTDFTDDQIFRIVILPSEFAEASKLDTSNIENVMSALNIGEEQVTKLDIN